MRTSQTITCPPLTDLRQFLHDDLPQEQASRVHTHVTECDQCQQLLEDLLGQQGGISTLEEMLRNRGCDAPFDEVVNGLALAMTETPCSSPEFAPQNGDQEVKRQPFNQPLPQSIGGYRVLGILGQGAYGVVFHAHDDTLDRPLALKIPRPNVVRAAGGIELYLKEAKALARLDHAHIVRVYEARPDGQNSCYIASQYIAGSSLAERLKQQPLTHQEAVALVACLADALQHAHERGIWHRDVKPANILLDTSGKPYLTDFGLALKADEISQGAGGLQGTPAYMSPEQARGDGQRVDGRTDIFSLGVVLHEALTGKRPFHASSINELLQLVMHVDAPSVRQKDRTVPVELDRICSKALSRELQDRYRSASELADDLQAWLKSVGAAGARGKAGRIQSTPTTQDGNTTESGQVKSVGGFLLRTRIGSGGMGVVYRAQQSAEDREVALKCLRVENDAARSRFLTEIRALGKVEHPNLVRIYTSGEDQDRLYFAMELVDGTGLASLLQNLRHTDSHSLDEAAWLDAVLKAAEQSRGREQPLSGVSTDAPTELTAETHDIAELSTASFCESNIYIQRVTSMVHDLALAAQALHDAGVVHRDIKPDNILLSRDARRAVLMDLGIAKVDQDDSGRVTRTREFVGSLRYASPEQIIDAGEVDHRSDIYSLGVTLWELLTLRSMYGIDDDSHDFQAMLKIEIDEPEPVRKYNRAVPRDLQAIVQKCLEKNPDRRYGSADALAEDLGRFLQGQPVQARPVGLAARCGRRWRRRPLVPSLVLTLTVLASLLAAASWPEGAARSNSLRLAIKPWVGFAPLVVAADLGLCEGMDLQLVPVQHAHEIHQRIVACELDAGPYVVDSHALSRADGERTKVVLQLDVSGTADAIVSRRGIDTIADLRGNKVAYVHLEAPHFLLLSLCEKYHVQTSEFTPVLAESVEHAVKLFCAGEVDAVVAYEPFLSQALAVPGAHPLATANDDPGAIIDTLMVREEYLANHPAQVQKLIAAWFKAVELLECNDPQAMESACRFLGEGGQPISREEYQVMVQGMTYGSIDRNLDFFRPNADGSSEFRRRMNTAQERWARHGLIRGKTDPQAGDGSEVFLQHYGS